MSNYLTQDDLVEIIETIESFELQDIYKVLGDNFFDVIDIINHIEDFDDRIIMLGALDKLLNTSKTGLVEYDDVFLTRKRTTKEEKNYLLDVMIEHRIKDKLFEIFDENPELSEVDNVIMAFTLVNLFNTVGANEVDSIILNSDEEEEIIDYLMDSEFDIDKFVGNLTKVGVEDIKDLGLLETIKHIYSI